MFIAATTKSQPLRPVAHRDGAKPIPRAYHGRAEPENDLKLYLLIGTILCVWICGAGMTLAQNTQEPQSLPRPPASVPSTDSPDTSPASVNFSGTWSPRSSLETGGGISRNSWTGDVGLRVPVVLNPDGPDLFAGFGFSYTGSYYHFSGQPSIVGSSRPWNQVNIGTVSAALFAKVDDHWSAFAGFDVTSAGASGADMGQTFTYGGVLGAGYRFSDKLSVGLGLAAQSRLEDNPLVVPFPTFDWVLPFDQDRWRVFAGGGAGGSGAGGRTPGVGIGISYQPMRPLTLSAGISSLGIANDFRLGPHAAAPNGVVRDEYSQLVLAANYQPGNHLSLTGFAGADLPGKLKVISSTGNTLYSEHDSVTPVVGVSLDWRF
jgi:hypothetical protein